MDNPKNQIVDRLKEANNVLVTVSANPSVDQLAAAIGLTLLLNKLGKHATAVYSGATPSTIEFLEPEATLEKNTDSLRDFIISLDKSKADKLRYKVEDKMVKIFITPYRTSISDQDLEFSQGDFNVEMVIGLGVRVREDLDQAITTSGRILHDATVASINTAEAGNLGTINWVDNQASSLCEMVVAMADMLKTGQIDEQMATALLTGIVAETERFSNAKTTSNTMAASAKLMAAGANQQLIATKLQEPEVPPESDEGENESDENDSEEGGDDGANEDGSLSIKHDEDAPSPTEDAQLPEPRIDEIDIDAGDNLEPADEEPRIRQENRAMALEAPLEPGDSPAPGYDASPVVERGDSRFIKDPPTIDGQLTASSEPDTMDPSTDPLKESHRNDRLLDHGSGPARVDEPPVPSVPPAQSPQISPAVVSELPEDTAPQPTIPEAPASIVEPLSIPEPPAAPDETEATAVDDEPQVTAAETLAEIEQSVGSSHANQSPDDPVTEVPAQPEPSDNSALAPDLSQARDAVQSAVAQSSNAPLEPIAALNAAGELDVEHDENPPESEITNQEPVPTPDIHIGPDGEIKYLSGTPDGTVAAAPPDSPQPDSPVVDSLPPYSALPSEPAEPSVTNPTAPPPVPPPMMPPMPPATPPNNSFTPTPNPFTSPPAL